MNMNVREILENITKEHASDIFVVAGRPLTYKVSGKMHTYQEERMKPDMCRDFVTAIYELADHRDISQFETTGDEHHSLVGVGKFHHSIRDHQFTWLWQSECDDSDDGGVRATLFISADTES